MTYEDEFRAMGFTDPSDTQDEFAALGFRTQAERSAWLVTQLNSDLPDEQLYDLLRRSDHE